MQIPRDLNRESWPSYLVATEPTRPRAAQPRLPRDLEAVILKAIDRNPRLPFYNLNIDAGALWARRMIDRLLAAEHGHGARPPGVAAE